MLIYIVGFTKITLNTKKVKTIIYSPQRILRKMANLIRVISLLQRKKNLTMITNRIEIIEEALT